MYAIVIILYIKIEKDSNVSLAENGKNLYSPAKGLYPIVTFILDLDYVKAVIRI